MSYRDVGPETFPGGGWYAPSVSTGATFGTLPLPTDEAELEVIREAERRRRDRPFGFARALEDGAE